LKWATKHALAGVFWAHALLMGSHPTAIIKPAKRVFRVMGANSQKGESSESELSSGEYVSA
jgi:hypothetical protein